MDVAVALAKAGGAARWEDLLALGVTEWALKCAREAGTVVVPHRGTYALPSADRAVVAAAAVRGQVTCVSACARWKLRQLDPPEAIHIAVPTTRHIKEDRLAELGLPGVHRGAAWYPGRSVASVAQALDAAALCTTPMQQLVMADAALEARIIDRAQLRMFRCGPASRRAWLASAANGGAMSVSETVARATLVAAGFRPRIQVRRPGVGTLDFAVGRRFFIEVDGYEEHSKWKQFRLDRMRDRMVSAARDWTLRYTYWDAVEDPRWFAHDVSRIVGVPVQRRFDARMDWLLALPPTALNLI